MGKCWKNLKSQVRWKFFRKIIFFISDMSFDMKIHFVSLFRQKILSFERIGAVVMYKSWTMKNVPKFLLRHRRSCAGLRMANLFYYGLK